MFNIVAMRLLRFAMYAQLKVAAIVTGNTFPVVGSCYFACCLAAAGAWFVSGSGAAGWF